jgi:Transposase domain (DUF772)
MRGKTDRQTSLLTLNPEDLIPADHPIRRIKPVVDTVLRELSPTFDAMYHERGRSSVPPEQLLKASVLMSLYSVRSERQVCERLRYDLLFKWFLDLNVEDEGLAQQLLQESRAAAATRGGPAFLRGGGGAGAAAQVRLRPALHCRRHPSRGLGLGQKFRASQRRAARGRTHRRWPQSGGGLPRTEAKQPDASLHHRP